MGAGRYRKKPVVIDAIQWQGRQSWEAVFDLACGSERKLGLGVGEFSEHLSIVTSEGQMWASPGDWIIRGVEGELYPCKPSIFEKTYEPEITR